MKKIYRLLLRVYESAYLFGNVHYNDEESGLSAGEIEAAQAWAIDESFIGDWSSELDMSVLEAMVAPHLSMP